MCEYLWACAVTTWIQSWENDCASCGDTCDVLYRRKLEICFQGQVGGSLSWDVKCQDTCVLVKPSQAPEMPECVHCQQNHLLVFPRVQSWEPWTPDSSQQPVQRGQKTKSLCCCLLYQTIGRERGSGLCPTPAWSFQVVFPQDCWCLTESRESTFIPTAIHNFGDSILEPWVVRLEEQEPWCIFLLIEKSTLNVINQTFIKPLQYEKVILLHWCEKGCTR